MYEIKREAGKVIVNKYGTGGGAKPILNASDDSYLVYNNNGVPAVGKLKDLPDADLLLALANHVDLRL